MIEINELRVTPDNECLIIDASIQDLDYFKNVTIDKVILNTQDTYLTTGANPGENDEYVIYTKDKRELDTIKDNKYRHIHLEVKSPLINTKSNNIYFVYIFADTTAAPEVATAPCVCNEEILMGVAVNDYNLYKTLIDSVPELEENCSEATSFITNYLSLRAIETCISVGDYTSAIEHWKKYMMSNTISKTSKTCGCNGAIN